MEGVVWEMRWGGSKGNYGRGSRRIDGRCSKRNDGRGSREMRSGKGR